MRGRRNVRHQVLGVGLATRGHLREGGREGGRVETEGGREGGRDETEGGREGGREGGKDGPWTGRGQPRLW